MDFSNKTTLDRRITQQEMRQYRSADAVLKPLTLAQLSAGIATIRPIANSQRAKWCVIGGAAVMTHLLARGMDPSEASMRSSFDIDCLANLPLNDHRAVSLRRLIGGGHRYVIAGTTLVDWADRSRDPQAVFYQRILATTKDVGDHIPVPAAKCLVAMKCMIPQIAMRLKDRIDVRLLLASGATTIDETMDFIRKTVDPRSAEIATKSLRKITNIDRIAA